MHEHAHRVKRDPQARGLTFERAPKRHSLRGGGRARHGRQVRFPLDESRRAVRGAGALHAEVEALRAPIAKGIAGCVTQAGKQAGSLARISWL